MISREHARKIRKRIEQAAISLSDEDALDAQELYPTWKAGTEYAVDVRVRHEDKLYRCVQAHTSQSDWTPDITPALWVEVAKPGEIDVWKQPKGAHDAYNIGAKVHYPGKEDPVYVSVVDNNIWAPNVYGWELVG